MAVRSGRRLRRVDQVPDSESDDDSVPYLQPIDLSDDDEGNATSPPPVQIPRPVHGARHPVEVVLTSRGVRPRTEWLESCLNELAITHPGFAGLPVANQAELCFGQFLMTDFNVAGAASLPPAMHSLHGTELPGPFVLQVDEVIDISHSLRDRYQEKKAGSGRTLKLAITDGVQRVCGLEYRPIGALQVFSPAGMKISLKNVCVKRGLLMLVPEVLEILGGSVEPLESARLRAVQVINKPPRGRRTREGDVEPSLAETATRAAWSVNSEGSVENNHQPQQRTTQAVSNNAEGTRHSNTISDPGPNHPTRGDVQQETERTMHYYQPVQSNGQSAQVSHFQQSTRATYVHQVATVRNTQQDQPAQTAGQSGQFQHSFRSASLQQGGQQQPVQQDRFANPSEQSFGVSESHCVELESRQQAGHVQQSVEQHQEVHLSGSVQQQGVHDAEPRRVSMTTNTVQESTSIQAPAESNRRPQSTPTFGRLSLSQQLVQSKLPTRPQPQDVVEQPVQPNDAAAVTTSPMDLDDSQESGHSTPAISSNPTSRVDTFRERVPFTYLSILKDRTNPQLGHIGVVRGKVKCVITGVIGFQYKDVDEFKLHIHIEDGSLITTAFVQHQLVQRLVGYSPGEVISGLQDPHTHKEMLDNMIHFQKLLERYDGLMEVEFSVASSVPTVIEMTEGLQYEDIKLLCGRVHQSRSMQTPNTNKLIPTIDLSTP